MRDWLLCALFGTLDWIGYTIAKIKLWYHCYGFGHEPTELLDTEDKHVICLGCKTCCKTFWIEEHINMED